MRYAVRAEGKCIATARDHSQRTCMADQTTQGGHSTRQTRSPGASMMAAHLRETSQKASTRISCCPPHSEQRKHEDSSPITCHRRVQSDGGRWIGHQGLHCLALQRAYRMPLHSPPSRRPRMQHRKPLSSTAPVCRQPNSQLRSMFFLPSPTPAIPVPAPAQHGRRHARMQKGSLSKDRVLERWWQRQRTVCSMMLRRQLQLCECCKSSLAFAFSVSF